MVVHDSGLNAVRDLIADDIYSAVFGTDSSAIVVTDTDLGGEVAGTEDASPLIETSDKKITVTANMNSTTGNGNTFYEWGLTLNSGATLFSRAVGAGVTKNSSIEIVRITEISIDRP